MSARDAFSAEMVTHLPFLNRFARKLTFNVTAAEDLVQDTVERALKAWESFTPGTNMRGWLAFILRNHFYSDRRRAWRNVQMAEGQAERTLIAIDNPLMRLELQDTLTALQFVRPEHREALLLIAEGVDYDTAAQMLGTEVGTVKSRVSRGRTELELYFNAA